MVIIKPKPMGKQVERPSFGSSEGEGEQGLLTRVVRAVVSVVNH